MKCVHRKILQLIFAIQITVLMANLESGSLANAQGLDEDKIRGNSSPKPVTVLQNRYFLKSWRPEVGFIWGSMLNEAYTNTTSYGGRVGLFISEWIGFEYQFLKTSISDTDDRTALNTLRYRPLNPSTDNTETIVSPDPEINAIHSLNDLSVLAAPFYGKLNLVDKFIIYSDLYLSAGASRVVTDQGVHGAFTFGAGQRFYFSGNWSARIDFKDRIYNEQRAGKKTRKHSYSFDIGASYLFF
ncbi:MAG: outer membrane beta-barrel domain-containing protein [Bdellovibrionota bacterium]